MSANNRLPGYVDLRGQPLGVLAQHLPIFLAQPEIDLVRILLKDNVPYERTVQFYRWGRWHHPVHVLPFSEAYDWCRSLYDAAEKWPAECLPDEMPSGHSCLCMSSVLTFYVNGRLRLNSDDELNDPPWYAAGQWREIRRGKPDS